MTNHRLSLGPTTRQMAERLATELEAFARPHVEALSIFEADESGRRWRIDAYYGTANDASRAAMLAVARGIAPQAIELSADGQADWVGQSLKELKPVQAGRFFVHGSHDRALRPSNSIAIEIDAATAFGTGHHGTTRGCLLALDHVLKTGTPESMIDIGSGSGILAIAYCKAARRPALACDNDPEAVRVTQCNARLNGAKVITVLADGTNHRSIAARRFDFIMSNILARPLAALAPAFARLAADNACLVLSGLLPDQRQWIERVYRQWEFVPLCRFELEGWCTLLLKKKSPGQAR
jgi:ribosomal protein L11 methyltransferase